MNRLSCAVAVGLASVAISARAATFDIQNFDQGWYQYDGSHQVNNTNIALVEQDYVNFVAFDLSGLAGQTVISATVTYAADLGSYDAFQFTDPHEVFDLYDFVGVTDDLLSGNGGSAAFNDLADGIFLGSTNILTPLPANGTQSPNPAGAMPEVNVDLNSAGISYLNGILSATDYRVIFGGSSQTLANFPNTQYIWGGSGASGLAVSLTLEVSPASLPGCGPSGGRPPKCDVISPVPIPAALPLLLAGIGCLGFIALFRNRGICGERNARDKLSS